MIKHAHISRPNYDAFFNTVPKSEPSQFYSAPGVNYPFCNQDLKNNELPLIPADVVKQQDGEGPTRLCEPHF